LSFKTSIQDVLKDTSNSFSQIQKIVATLEVFSDLNIEYSSIINTMNILPLLINDIQSSMTGLVTQSLTSPLLPTESIEIEISENRQASISAAVIEPYMSKDGFNVIVTIPEFYKTFNIYAVNSLPFKPPSSSSYISFIEPQSFPVAVNIDNEFFNFNPALCHNKYSITVCAPHLTSIRRIAQTCSEAIVLKQNLNICIENAIILGKPYQSYTHKQVNTVRIFSPYPDTIEKVCKSQQNNTLVKISEGYTDIDSSKDCIIYTKELIILPPAKLVSTTEFKGIQIPNLEPEFRALMSDVHLTHNVNLTQLSADLNKLNSSLLKERLDLKKANVLLQQETAFKEISQIHNAFPKFNNLTAIESFKSASSYSTAFLIVLIAFLLIHCYCPCVTNNLLSMIKNVFRRVVSISLQIIRRIAAAVRQRMQNDTDNDSNTPPLISSNSSHSTDTHYAPHAPVIEQLERIKIENINSDIEWTITVDRNRARIVAHGDQTLYWDTVLQAAINEDRVIITSVEPPPSETIERFVQIIQTLPYPKFIKIGDSLCLQTNVNVKLDRSINKLVDRVTNSPLDGYNIPADYLIMQE